MTLAPAPSPRAPNRRRRRVVVAVTALLVLAGPAAKALPVQTDGGQTEEIGQAIHDLENTRASIDETLELLDENRRTEAFSVSREGYLNFFENVEIALRPVDPDLTLRTEQKFAEIRGLLKTDAPTSDIRARVVELRNLVDDGERALTDAGLGAPLLAFGQSFMLLLREGFEAVLLLSLLLGYLESTKSTRHARPVLYGVGAAVLASVVLFFAVDAIFSVLPFSEEILNAFIGGLAVVVMLGVSFWLIARLEQRRWLEFMRARVWTAVSAGSATTLALIGFTAVFRQGFETALFARAITNYGTGLAAWVVAGMLAAAVVLGLLSLFVFRYRRAIPMRTLLVVSVVVVALTSIAFAGNAVTSLQQSGVLEFRRLVDWPRLPIFLAETTGYHPTVETVVAQGTLLVVYAFGCLYLFVVRPRRRPAASGVDDLDLDEELRRTPVGSAS